MAKYATGKYAKAISDRSGLEFPYREMVREWNGSFVHVSEFEPKQPIYLEKYEDCPGMGRIAVMDSNQLAMMGKVIEVTYE